MAKLKLSPPWNIRVSEITELFKQDRDVHVVYDEDNYEIKLYVDNDYKASALQTLLPEIYDFGNVKLKVTIIPANTNTHNYTIKNNDMYHLLEYAFYDNQALSFIQRISGIFANDLIYVVFVNKVVQYYDDNLGDIYGNCSTLYQEIAKNVFGYHDGVFFCTDCSENTNVVERPNWP